MHAHRILYNKSRDGHTALILLLDCHFGRISFMSLELNGCRGRALLFLNNIKLNVKLLNKYGLTSQDEVKAATTPNLNKYEVDKLFC